MKFPIAGKTIALSASAIALMAITACDDSSSASDDALSSSSVNLASSATEPTISANSSSSTITQGSSDSQLSSSAESGQESSAEMVPESSATVESSNSGPVAPSGSFTDSRDGKTYNLVKIGTQTWMAENLHYADSNLYNFADAQVVCPEGYHLPTLNEFRTLVDYAGGLEIAGQKLKSTTGWPIGDLGDWNGTDDFGFNAKPVEKGNGTGTDQNFWSSSHNFNNFSTGDFLKINPYPVSYQDYVWEENVGVQFISKQCDDANGKSDSSSTAACFINGEPDTKLSVRCMSDIVECGGINIDSKKQFCQEGSAYNICSGHTYDGTKYVCRNDSLYDIATGEIYKQSWKLLNPQITYGLFKDERDGQYYKTIKINGVTWFAENLNYAADSSKCFNDEQFYCDIYGRLYSVEQARNGDSATTANPNIQGLCPPGSRMSTSTEYFTLFRQYMQDLFTKYNEGDYLGDVVNRDDPTGFSMALSSCGRGFSSDWGNLNIVGCYIGADYTHEFFRWWPNEFDSMDTYYTYGSVRCVVK